MSLKIRQSNNPACKLCASDNVIKYGKYKNWADITRHKPSKPITISHVKRGTMKLPKTQIGRPKKRIRITPKTPPPISLKRVRLER